MVRLGYVGIVRQGPLWDARAATGGSLNVGETPMAARSPEAEPLLTPAEVATMFRVDPKTVTRWAKAGKLSSIRTLGGHRRYKESEVRALLGGIPTQREG
jgi:excisionase family DNA binding protein